MFQRLWLVLSIIWAGMVFAPELLSPGQAPMSKLVIIAFLPMVIGPVMGSVARWVVRGPTRRD
jgi:hypothetical protein